MRTEGLRVLSIRATYAVVLIGAIAWATLLLYASATNGTLAYDFEAYHRAVQRFLGGERLYDVTATALGPATLFFYPPPFTLLVLPFALIPWEIGKYVWTAALVAAAGAAIATMPVATRTRYVLLMLAAFSWPLVYAIKLGQVGPVLLLLFAAGWRWLDRPTVVGLVSGLGTVIKLQPVLLIGWALVTRRWRAAAVSIAVLVVLAAAFTLVAGIQPWFDWLAVIGRVSHPVIADNDTGVGRLAFLAGVPEGTATLIHYVNVAAVVVVTLLVTLRGSPVAGYLAVIVASQFVSPVLWPHYALLLLLPVAWLLDRGWWWTAIIPLATSTFLTQVTPAIAYPVTFWVTLLAIAGAGLREGREDRARDGARRPLQPLGARET